MTWMFKGWSPTTRRRGLCLGLMVLGLGMIPEGTRLTRADERGNDPKTAVVAELERIVAKGEAAGIAALVIRGGRVELKEGRGDLSPDEVFQAASSSKPITAAVVMALVDRGKLSLDDPVGKYVPEIGGMRLKGGEAAITPMTLRHVLTNTSGLPGDFSPEGGVPPLFGVSLAASCRELSKLELLSQPGATFRYCTTGFNLAARAVEVVEGEPFETVAKRLVLDPLKMTRTAYLGPAIPFKREPGEGRFVLAGGAMTTTLEDLGRFYRMLADEGTFEDKRVLSADSVRVMTTRQTDLSANLVGDLGQAYGIALFLDRLDDQGRARLATRGFWAACPGATATTTSLASWSSGAASPKSSHRSSPLNGSFARVTPFGSEYITSCPHLFQRRFAR